MKSKFIATLAVIALPLSLVAQVAPKDPSELTTASNASVLQQLPFAEKSDFQDASRGLIAELPEGVIKTRGVVNWDLNRYAFLQDDKVPPWSILAYGASRNLI